MFTFSWITALKVSQNVIQQVTSPLNLFSSRRRRHIFAIEGADNKTVGVVLDEVVADGGLKQTLIQ